MSTAAVDRLSFTLPDWRAALKRRIKRPRRPSPGVLVWLLIFVAGGLWNLAEYVRDPYFSSLLTVGACAMEARFFLGAWKRGDSWHGALAKRDPRVSYGMAAWWATTIALGLLGF